MVRTVQLVDSRNQGGGDEFNADLVQELLPARIRPSACFLHA
jgi:hypothetical protein